MILRLARRTRHRVDLRDGQWRRHYLLLPRVVQFAGRGRHLAWLCSLQRRWSATAGCWQWR